MGAVTGLAAMPLGLGRTLFGWALALAFGLGLQVTGLLSPIELWSLDRLAATRSDAPTDPRVVVIAIDEQALTDIGERFPFRRSIHAAAIDRIARGGARVIAYDIDFTQQTTIEEDNALIDSLRRAGTGILAVSGTTDGGETAVLGGAKGQASAKAEVGHTAYPADRDGRIRKLPRETQGIPSFAVAVAARAGHKVDPSAFHRGRAWLNLTTRACDLDVDRSCGTRTVRFSDILRWHRTRLRREFRDAIVVVGATAPALQDNHLVWGSSDHVMSGAQLNAEAIATVLSDFPLRRSPLWLTALLVLLVITLPALIDMALVRRGRRQAGAVRVPGGPTGALAVIVAGGVATAAAFGVGVWVFGQSGWVVPLQVVLAAGAFATALAGMARYFVDSLTSNMLVSAAGGIVGEANVEELLHVASGAGEEPAVKRAAIMFVDLAGSMQLTQDLGPSERFAFASAYQELVTGVVFDHGGAIVDLMGDGVMAAFGVLPETEADFSSYALRAARTLCDRMEVWTCSALLGVAERPRIRVGIATGDVAVGFTGGEQRFEFAVIGHATNLASRLQSAAGDGEPPDAVWVDEDTWSAASPVARTALPLTSRGARPIKGLKSPVQVFGWRRP